MYCFLENIRLQRRQIASLGGALCREADGTWRNLSSVQGFMIPEIVLLRGVGPATMYGGEGVWTE